MSVIPKSIKMSTSIHIYTCLLIITLLTIDKYKTVTVSDWIVHCVISTGKVVSVRPLYTIEGESYIRSTTHTTACERQVSVPVSILRAE